MHHSQQTGSQSHRDGSQSVQELVWELQLSDLHDVKYMIHPWTTVKQKNDDINKVISNNKTQYHVQLSQMECTTLQMYEYIEITAFIQSLNLTCKQTIITRNSYN